MSMNWVLGAINKESGEYENLWFVNKKIQYQCIGCANNLVLRMGQKNFQSFIHKVPSGCEYFKNPSNEQLISDANLFLIQLLKTKQVNLFRKCNICKFQIKVPGELFSNIQFVKLENNIVYCYDNIDNANLIAIFYTYIGHPFTDTLANLKNEHDDNKIYLINITQLIQKLVRDFASGKVELTCAAGTVCANCKKYLN